MENQHNVLNKDVNLTKRILERIRWDKRISNADVHVISKMGKVTLIGEVDSAEKKEAAKELTSSIKGVTYVTNQLEIREMFERSDDEIKALIQNRLQEFSFHDREFISVGVHKGKVKLAGVVKNKEKKARAAGFVWELSGVKDCENVIRIDDASSSRTTLHKERPMILTELNPLDSFSRVNLAL